MAINIGRTALALGALLAYQNRDRIADLLKNRAPNEPNSAGGGLFDNLLGTGSARSGLSEILDRFRGTGSQTEVESWIGKEPNRPLNKQQVEAAIDEETLQQLSALTGLTREELIERITRDLPQAVDSLTPDGSFQILQVRGRQTSTFSTTCRSSAATEAVATRSMQTAEGEVRKRAYKELKCRPWTIKRARLGGVCLGMIAAMGK